MTDQQINDGGPDGKSREHWLEQAELAWDYAFRRPASDLDGFFASLRDREEFLRLAAREKEGRWCPSSLSPPPIPLGLRP